MLEELAGYSKVFCLPWKLQVIKSTFSRTRKTFQMASKTATTYSSESVER